MKKKLISILCAIVMAIGTGSGLDSSATDSTAQWTEQIGCWALTERGYEVFDSKGTSNLFSSLNDTVSDGVIEFDVFSGIEQAAALDGALWLRCQRRYQTPVGVLRSHHLCKK